MAYNTYWVGQDGNVWTRQGDSIANQGGLIQDYNGNGFDAAKLSGQTNGDLVWQRINDPNAPRQTGGGGVDNSASINTLQNQLGNLDQQQNIGLNNIANGYNLSANRLDEQKAQAQRDYTTQGNLNTQNYTNTRNNVISNTRATANSLQRLLGINGAGNSSAAYEQAPYAAGLQGTQNLTAAQQTYGNNQSALDTKWGDTQRSYKNSLDDLNGQKFQNENNLKSSIAKARIDLLDKIGQLRGGTNPYEGQINDLLAQITQLGNQYANPVMRTADISFAAPNLSQYSLGRMAAPTQGGAQSDLAPTMLGLLTGQDKRDQFGNPIQA